MAETCVCLIVALVVFGPKQLPELARRLGYLVQQGQVLYHRLQTMVDQHQKELELAVNIDKAKEADVIYQESSDTSST